MKIISLSLMPLGANCYIVYDDNGKGIVVDPGGEADKIKDIIDDRNLDIEYILLTHGHGDHIGGVNHLRELIFAKVGVHQEDVIMLKDGNKNMAAMMGLGNLVVEEDFTFDDGEILEVGDLKVEVIHTPGHTPGGVCFKIEDILITGDTLFAGSVGRSDFPGGNQGVLINSIKNKLMVLDDNVTIYPGHEMSSTIGREKAYNPFLG